MDVNDSPGQQAFRQEVRDFLSRNLPSDIREKVIRYRRLGKDDFVRWHRIVHARGWAGVNWPRAYGGTGWTPVEQHIWDVESHLAGSPGLQPFGINMVGPVLMAYGSEAQRKRYLPRILSCDDWWCQGFSEPNAGSDLAALNLRAERVGDHYCLNGQKTWTTLAQHADMMFCLVRTNNEGRKQEGITFLLIDMKSPGIEVRPIRLMDGEADVNDVFFENVKIPVENRVGEENRGWHYAKYLLGHERVSIAGIGRSKRDLHAIKQLAGAQQHRGRPLLENPLFSAEIARIEIEIMALEMTVHRIANEATGDSGALASMLKITGTEIQQRLSELLMKVVGPLAYVDDQAYLNGTVSASLMGYDAAAGLAAAYFKCRATTIYGGSTEIQKNIIAQRGLGL